MEKRTYVSQEEVYPLSSFFHSSSFYSFPIPPISKIQKFIRHFLTIIKILNLIWGILLFLFLRRASFILLQVKIQKILNVRHSYLIITLYSEKMLEKSSLIEQDKIFLISNNIYKRRGIKYIDRKLLKLIVMTLPYSVFGINLISHKRIIW